MDLVRAWEVLGVPSQSGPDVVRRAYRAALREAHPDLSSNVNAGERTRFVVEAYRTVVAMAPGDWGEHCDIGGPDDAIAESGPGARAPSSAEPGVVGGQDRLTAWLLDDDTIALAGPGDEAFARLVEAAHRFGDLTYVDRHTGFLEALVRMTDGVTVSVVISLQGRADGTTEAFVTMEAIDILRTPLPPIRALTEEIVELLVEERPT